MQNHFATLQDAFEHGYDTVIDVRSPAEFHDDHIPGAINLPVLNDEERARVGTIYKQESPFKARKLGAALVFRNAARHVEDTLAGYGGGWRPLVYCWRGGQRSGSFTWLLREIGWRADVVQGGYKSYRTLVTKALYDTSLPHHFIQLGGYTGTAKTALLPLLAKRGVQVLDLEGLAGHRGSLLGGMPGGQPSQKGFETALAHGLSRLSTDRAVLVEAESSKIGALNLPPRLWEGMKAAPWVEITAPIEARARYLQDAYADVLADGAQLLEMLQPLKYHRGQALIDQWKALIEAGDKRALCRSLAEDHYDLAYRRSMKAVAPKVLAQCHADDLTPHALEGVADRLAEQIHTISR